MLVAFRAGTLGPRILRLTEQKGNPTYIFHLKCKLKGRYMLRNYSRCEKHRRIMQAGRRTGKESAAPPRTRGRIQ